MTLNKERIATIIHEKTNLPQSECRRITNAFFNTIIDLILKGETVKIIKLGTFKLMTRKEKKFKSIAKGDIVSLPERKKLVFKPSKWLREFINK